MASPGWRERSRGREREPLVKPADGMRVGDEDVSAS